MAQVVLQHVAEGVVVDKIAVAVEKKRCAQQVVHAFEPAAAFVSDADAVTYRESFARRGLDRCRSGKAHRYLCPALDDIGRTALAAKCVAGVHFVPVDLCISHVAAAPYIPHDGGSGLVREVGGQIAIVVWLLGIEPSRHGETVTRQREQQGGGQPCAASCGNLRREQQRRVGRAPYTRAAHPA